MKEEVKGSMVIELLNLKREYAFLKNDIDKQVKDCLSSQQWILGPKVDEFEAKAVKYLGAKYAIGVASGTDALILSLKALAIKQNKKDSFDKKDQIITTPFTFLATAEAIVRAGATPVFVDIDSESFNIDPKQIKKAVNKNTVGIIPVYLYGLGADTDEIKKIAKENNLFVVEDAAQAFGGGVKNKKLGTFGDCGAFSFFPSKNIGSFGDGGLIATNNKTLAQIIKALRNHGQSKLYNASFIGYNSRLDSIQAAVLLAKLKYVEKFNKKRQEVAKKYNQGLRGLEDISRPIYPKSYSHVYNLYTIKVKLKRDKLLKHLNFKGIGARLYYPVLLNQMKAFRDSLTKGKLKNSLAAQRQVLSLPSHPFLSDKEVDYIISVIKKFYNK